MMHRLLLLSALAAVPSVGANRIRGGVALATGQSPEAKVERVLLDIDESVRKAGEDAELVFAQFANYEQQFGVSLDRELLMLNETLTKLNAMNTEYRLEVNSSKDELQYLGSSMQGSQQAADAYGKGEAQAGRKFDSLISSVRTLSKLLLGARVTPGGALATAESPDSDGQPKRVYAAMWQLLSSFPKLQMKFPDVYTAFAPTASNSGEHPAFTQNLIQRSVKALATMGMDLQKQRTQSLLQLEGHREQFATEASNDLLNTETQRGVQAEEEQKSDELMFSINFTNAVLLVDQSFRNKVRTHTALRMNLSTTARNSRDSLLKTLKDTISLLDAQVHHGAPPAEQTGAVSLLETHSSVAGAKEEPAHMSTLQTTVEDAIRKHTDTHAILMKIKAVLDQSQPIDAGSVQGVVTKMSTVLRAAESEQSRGAEAAQHCQAQKLRSVQEDRGLTANLALMEAAQNHTHAAIQAAKSNLAGIAAKAGALGRSARDFAGLAKQAGETLSGQSRDRGTIIAAVGKAREVVQHAMPASTKVANSLERMTQELKVQDELEKTYRKEEGVFRSALAQYATDYTSLLRERRSHYKQSLAALDLYTSELANDVLAQKDALSANGELVSESNSLCDSVLHFYKLHNQRKSELTNALRTVLPKVPSIMSMNSAPEE